MTVKIYALENPITEKIMYIGASLNPIHRYNSHCSGASWHPITSRYKEMMDLKSKGIKPKLLILGETDRENAKNLEQYWINYYILNGHNLKQLKTSTYPKKPYINYVTKFRNERNLIEIQLKIIS